MIHQISLFDDEPLTWFEKVLLRGSLTAGGKYRIYSAAVNLSVTELADFLKEEYGWSGSSVENGFVDYSPKGARLKKWHSDYEENYTWAEVAKKIKNLVYTDKYLSTKEKEYIKSLQEHFGCIPAPRARYGYGEGWA